MNFVLRALQSPDGLNGAFRVHLHPDHLEAVGLKNGEICEITGGEDGTTLVGYGIAWRGADKMGNAPRVRPAKTTETLRTAFSIKEGSQVNVCSTKARIVKADKVVLTDVTPGEYSMGVGTEDEKWWWRCGFALMNCEAFSSGHTFEVSMSTRKDIKKRFYIEHIEATGVRQGSPCLFYSNDNTKVVFADSTSSRPSSSRTYVEQPQLLSGEYIGGLEQQLQTLNEHMKLVLDQAKLPIRYQVDNGILIHGYEGTGKSLILEQIERARFQEVFRLDRSILDAGAMSKTRDVIVGTFNAALAKQPSIIVIDDLHELALSTEHGSYGRAIAAGLDKLRGAPVVVAAACRERSEIQSMLLDPGRLSCHVELPIPDMQARASILRVTLGSDNDSSDSVVRKLSLRTHGFTGKDIRKLVEVARNNALHRYVRQQGALSPRSSVNGSFEQRGYGTAHSSAAVQTENEQKILEQDSAVQGSFVDMEDFEVALKQVRPTALREIFFEKPQTQWSDIGGSQPIKKLFDRIIGGPLESSESMKEYGLTPKKGVLLYGPPGCSKTLTAQAVATSYDLNFIAIKGAELISMYVGESERAIREIFRKARAAAPCVVFFDEIDSIASERESAGTKGLNVLTTLLNEMDGFDSMRNVLVLAATNKPDLLDPAIMRPGRFDSHIYLGPPNSAARKEIFAVQTTNIPTQGELDLDKLAEATDGYSGAETVKICTIAKEAALERDLAGGVRGVSMADLEAAVKSTSRGITADVLSKYGAFARTWQNP